MYEIEFSNKAKTQFLKLSRDVKIRIGKSLERFRIRPGSYFERLVGEKLYRARVGDYRIIADIDGGKLMIFVIKVGHRKNIYK